MRRKMARGSIGLGTGALLAIVAFAPPGAAQDTRRGSLQIVPGGLGLEVGERLDRLDDALRRLGDRGEAVDERLAMIVHGDYRIPAGTEVAGHVALLGGTLRLSGTVEGNLLMLDGRLLLDDGARIEGDVLQVGGELELEGTGIIIEGEIVSDLALGPEAEAGSGASRAAEAPTVVERARAPSRLESSRGGGLLGRAARNLGRAAAGLFDSFSTFVSLGLLGLLLVYFMPRRLETVSDTVRHEFPRSFAMGLAGQVLFFPALLLLVVLVITWPIVPFFVLGTALAGLLGYLAAAHGAGEMFSGRRYRYEWMERLRGSNSYSYVLAGLGILLLPFAATAVLWLLGGAADVVRGLIFSAACLATWVVASAGFGAVLLTRAGGRSVVVDWSSGPESEMGDDPSDPLDSPAPGPTGGPAGVADAEASSAKEDEDA